jgi:tripartite-type tricarboxylate transporter receptor subunit TctC
MFRSMRQGMASGIVLGLVILLSPFAASIANAYPEQPIKVIVSFPPGGSADIVIRAL